MAWAQSASEMKHQAADADKVIVAPNDHVYSTLDIPKANATFRAWNQPEL